MPLEKSILREPCAQEVRHAFASRKSQAGRRAATVAALILHWSLRKIIKTHRSYPTDEAALKLLFLAIRNAGVHWRRPVEWTAAIRQFAILFEDRFPASAR